MSAAPTPDGYDVSKRVPVAHPGCEITVGFDRHQNYIPRFLVRLHYTQSGGPPWKTVAQFDHNENDDSGHDIYEEGLHLDMYLADGRTLKLRPVTGGLDPNPGVVIRGCVDYLEDLAEYLLSVRRGEISASQPPPWPRGKPGE